MCCTPSNFIVEEIEIGYLDRTKFCQKNYIARKCVHIVYYSIHEGKPCQEMKGKISEASPQFNKSKILVNFCLLPPIYYIY